MTLQNILKEKKGTIVDVRSPEEFMGGNVVGSINIPLQEIPQRLEELKTLNQPIILCCASGMRSGQAHGFLNQQGIKHLITDLPSIDREEDGGALAGHKAFWDYPEHPANDKTITEMVYVENTIPDGLYFCNIQIISIELDASPSKIVLYPLVPVQI